jgi:hypothetical protein
MAQMAILSLNKGNIDKCLIAIFFMSRYEEVIHKPNNQKTASTSTLQSYSHHDGSRAVLKLWKNRFSQSQPASDVVKHTRRGLIRSALLRKIGVPEWMRDGAEFGEHGLDLEYDSIVVRLANLRQRLTVLCKSEDAAEGTTYDFELLHDEAQDLDIAFQNWTTHFPSTWQNHGQTIPKSPILPPGGYPIKLRFSSSSFATIWSQYFAIRMLMISTRLEILEGVKINPQYSEEYRSQERTERLLDMSIMAECLASSAPFCLQKDEGSDGWNRSVMTNAAVETMPYMASTVIWPLSIASKIADVDPTKKRWFRSELGRLGRLTGIGVLECADTDQRVEF